MDIEKAVENAKRKAEEKVKNMTKEDLRAK